MLNAALDLFISSGYHASSMRMIADRASISIPGLYYHFASKADILLALIDRAHTELRERLDQALEEAGPKPYDRFVNFVEHILLFMTHRWRLSLIPRELESLDESLGEHHRKLRRAIDSTLIEIVEAGVQAKSFKSPNPHGDARAVLVLCRGVAQWYSPDGPQTPEQIAREYIRHSLAIVRGRTQAFS